jgi:hypothetical protein
MSKLCIINANNLEVTVTSCKTWRGVIKRLLDGWVIGEEDLYGVCGFMCTQGVDFGITDAELIDAEITDAENNEGPDISGFAARIRGWLKTADDSQVANFLAALEPTIRVRSRYDPDVIAALADGYRRRI